jgi:carbonic anhydrase
MQLRTWFVVLGLAATAAGCAKVKAAVCAGMVPAEQAAPVAKPTSAGSGAHPTGPAPGASGSEPSAAHEPPSKAEAQEQFALPFAWEKSPSEPLARTRAYLRDVARDNAAHMRRSPDFFKELVKGETPRATVLSCADSRVQTSAFDATPENDDFMVRNLANQIQNGLGSVEFGVEQLHTPLLVVMGHTGCDAIKSALGNADKLSGAVKRELTSLQLPKAAKSKKGLDDKLWRDAVIKNIHNQVETALATFANRVNAGELTIIGAVYDLRNELTKGAGRVSIINVNGVTEAERLKSFEDAVLAGAKLDAATGNAKSLDPFKRLSQVFDEHLQEAGPGEYEDEDESPAIESVIIAPRKPATSKAPPTPPPAPAQPAPPAAKQH